MAKWNYDVLVKMLESDEWFFMYEYDDEKNEKDSIAIYKNKQNDILKIKKIHCEVTEQPDKFGLYHSGIMFANKEVISENWNIVINRTTILELMPVVIFDGGRFTIPAPLGSLIPLPENKNYKPKLKFKEEELKLINLLFKNSPFKEAQDAYMKLIDNLIEKNENI